MLVQFFCFFIIIVFGFVYSKKKNDIGRKNYIVFCSMVVLLKAALRSVTIGRDTSHYAGYFYDSMKTPWSVYIDNFIERYSHLSGSDDAGYYLVQKVFSTVIPDFNVYTFFIQGLLFYLPLGIFVYRNTKDNLQVMFAYVLYNALFMGLPMANARQVYAIGFCIWAILFMAQKKPLWSVVFVILGYFFHASALLFFIPILMSFANTKVILFTAILSVIFFFVVLSDPNSVIVYMGNMIENDRYASYGMGGTHGGAITYISLSFLMSIVCIFAFWKKKDIAWAEKVVWMMIPPATFFTPLIYSNGSMMRITMYFQIFFIVLVPYTIDTLFKKNNRKTVYFLLMAILIMLSLLSFDEYRFFWEENQDPYINWT